MNTINFKLLKLDVPDKRSFHGSILPHNNKYICIYHNSENHRLGSIFLDKNLKYIENTHNEDLNVSYYTDPRIFQHLGEYYISTSKLFNGPAYMQLSKLIINDDKIYIDDNSTISFLNIENFNGYIKNIEKNWVFWSYDNKIYYTYSLNPHRILELTNSGTVKLIYETYWYSNNWWFNEVWTPPMFRLNVPPILIAEGVYLGIFHTMKKHNLKTKYHKIQPNNLLSYYTGFYTFSAFPPFKIISISNYPFISPDYELPENWPFHPPPSGGNPFYPFKIILQNKDVLIFGGSNEIAIAYTTIKLEDILNSMDLVNETSLNSSSRCGQDIFVYEKLNKKSNGFFLDFWNEDPIINNNTFALEKIGWKGISIGTNLNFRTTNYIDINKLPKNIDYLSFNYSENFISYYNKYCLFKNNIKIITVKHDCYCLGNNYKLEIMNFLYKLGFILIKNNVKVYYLEKDCEFEDWYINSTKVEEDY